MINDVEIQSAPEPLDSAHALISTARELGTALVVHADAIVAANGDCDLLVAADEALAIHLRAADAAYAALTGEAHPMRVEELYDEPAGCGEGCGCAGGSEDSSAGTDDDSHPHDDDDDDIELISVLQRHDFALTSAAELIQSGRDAYAVNFPDAEPGAAQSEVVDTESAIQQVGLAEGWSNLWRAGGIEAIGGVVAVLPQDEPLSGEPEEWADLVLDTVVPEDMDPIYVQVDVYDE